MPDVTGTTRERLSALTVRYNDAKEAFERHRDDWQREIRDAVDEVGMRPAIVAEIVGVTPQRIQAILERVYRALDE